VAQIQHSPAVVEPVYEATARLTALEQGAKQVPRTTSESPPTVRDAIVAMMRDALIAASADPQFRDTLKSIYVEALTASMGQMVSEVIVSGNGQLHA
jgi:hypothetical protein